MLHDFPFDQFDKNFPLTKPAKNSKRCEWYDLELKRLMLKKDRSYKKYLSRRDQASKTRHQKIRNQYFHLIRVKKKFYLQKFKNSGGLVVQSVCLLSCRLGFDSESSQTNDLKIGIHSFLA